MWQKNPPMKYCAEKVGRWCPTGIYVSPLPAELIALRLDHSVRSIEELGVDRDTLRRMEIVE